MIDRLIFDFDGMISDSYPVFVRIMRNVARDFDVKVDLSDEELMDKLRVSVKTCMEALDFQCTKKERIERFWYYQRLYYKEFKPFPEIEGILKKAIFLGKRNYIYTHSGSIVREMLENMGLSQYFTYVLDSTKGFPEKPAPDALLYLTETLGLPMERCIMIGDRAIDTMAGNNAGMRGCLWDAYDRYPDYETDYKIKTLSQLDALLDVI